jgi:flotillin
VYPFQKVSKISITPFDFSMGIQAITIEKLQFALPAVFTIGPADSMEALEMYTMLLTGESDGRPPAAASKGAITVATG